jgi:phosphoglycolate phosphatase
VSRPAVVFDLDGTLADTPSAIAGLIAAVLTESGVMPDPAAVLATVGRPLEVSFAELLGSAVDAPPTLAAAASYRARFADVVLTRGPELLFPGVVAGLERLRDAGVPLGVATSKISASAQALLTATGIRPFFDVVIGHDQVARGKPHPDMGLAALAALGAGAGSWYVGDTGTDMRMAVAAGMLGLGVSYGVDSGEALLRAGAHRVAGSVTELVGVLVDALAVPSPAILGEPR